jgi:hypothetical protein
MFEPVLGVDPGIRGGIAVLDGGGYAVHTAAMRPDMTEGDLLNAFLVALTALRTLPDNRDACYFEKVGYRPTDGGKGAFTFGRIVGLMSGILLARGIHPVYVSPMVWQSHHGCMTGGDKNVSKQKAQKLFPALKVTHAVADALLIARYGWERKAL